MASKKERPLIQFYDMNGYMITHAAVLEAQQTGICHFSPMLELNTDEEPASKHKPSADFDGALIYLPNVLRDTIASAKAVNAADEVRARKAVLANMIANAARVELADMLDETKRADLNAIIDNAGIWANALYPIYFLNPDPVKQDQNIIAKWGEELETLTTTRAQSLLPKIVRDKASEAESRGITSISIVTDTEVDGSCAYPERSGVVLHPLALKNPAAKLKFYKDVLRCCKLTPEEFESVCEELDTPSRKAEGTGATDDDKPSVRPIYKPQAYSISAPPEGAYRSIIKYKPDNFASSYWATMPTGDTRGTISSMDPDKMRTKRETRQTVLRMKYFFGETEAVRQSVDAHLPEHKALADMLFGEEILQRARYGCMRYPHGEPETASAPPSLSAKTKKQIGDATRALMAKNLDELEEGIHPYYRALQDKLTQAPALMIAALGSDEQLRRLKNIHKLEAAVDPEATPLQSEAIRRDRATLFNEVMEQNGISLQAGVDASAYAEIVHRSDHATVMGK